MSKGKIDGFWPRIAYASGDSTIRRGAKSTLHVPIRASRAASTKSVVRIVRRSVNSASSAFFVRN